MTRFTARAFRRRLSRKSKKSKTQTRRRRAQKGGGNTFSREIPKNAVIANVVEWDD